MGRYADQIDHTIGKVARRQHGCVTRIQLLELGLSATGVKRRVQAGRLIRVHTGVYAVGHHPNGPNAQAMAAVLACGPGAVLSHGAADALWGFRKRRSGPIELTAPRKHRRPGIKVHRSALTRTEKTKHLGIPVTTPARTLLDIAPSVTDKQLTRAINEALVTNYLREADLEKTGLERFVTGLSRSRLEDDFRPWLKRFGLPEPRYNVRVNGREVDAYYDRELLIVELDGFAFHKTRAAFEDDRERDASMLLAGMATIRSPRTGSAARRRGRLSTSARS